MATAELIPSDATTTRKRKPTQSSHSSYSTITVTRIGVTTISPSLRHLIFTPIPSATPPPCTSPVFMHRVRPEPRTFGYPAARRYREVDHLSGQELFDRDVRDLLALRRCWTDVVGAWGKATGMGIREHASKFSRIVDQLAARTDSRFYGDNMDHLQFTRKAFVRDWLHGSLNAVQAEAEAVNASSRWVASNASPSGASAALVEHPRETSTSPPRPAILPYRSVDVFKGPNHIEEADAEDEEVPEDEISALEEEESDDGPPDSGGSLLFKRARSLSPSAPLPPTKKCWDLGPLFDLSPASPATLIQRSLEAERHRIAVLHARSAAEAQGLVYQEFSDYEPSTPDKHYHSSPDEGVSPHDVATSSFLVGDSSPPASLESIDAGHRTLSTPPTSDSPGVHAALDDCEGYDKAVDRRREQQAAEFKSWQED
ncbi:hypothetical protein P7C70_g6961, partial [Phenoliferia sp. Uapishka_3]